MLDHLNHQQADRFQHYDDENAKRIAKIAKNGGSVQITPFRWI